MGEPSQLGMFLRDEGIARVMLSNETWMDRAFKEMQRFLLKQKVITGESVRLHISESIGGPSTPHAWGALIRKAVKSGLIRDTGRTTKMSDPRSHARRTPVWEVVHESL